MTKQSKLLNNVIGIGEIAVLLKHSPKHKQLLGRVQSNLECNNNGEVSNKLPVFPDLKSQDRQAEQQHT